MIDLISFSLYKRKKASSAHYNFAPRYKEVWLRGLKRHTANVLNREVPEVRILLLPQKARQLSWTEHDATNVGVGSSNLPRVTKLETWQSWLIAPVLKIAIKREQHQACLNDVEREQFIQNRQTETSQRFESFSLRETALWCKGKHSRF